MKWLHNFSTMVLMASIFVLFSMTAMAQTDISGFPIPEGDITKILLDLGTNYKTLGFAGILILVTLLTVQAIKAWVDDKWKYKRLLTLGVSIVYSIAAGFVVPGSNAVTIIISVFISSGGAVALYEALKGAGIIKKSPGIAIKSAIK